MANIAHSGRCSVAGKARNSHVLCFDTGAGNRTRAIGIVLGPGPHRGLLIFRGSFDAVTVGKHNSVKGVLAGTSIRGVDLGRGKDSALKNHVI